MSKYMYGPLMKRVMSFQKMSWHSGPVRLGVNHPHDERGAGRGMRVAEKQRHLVTDCSRLFCRWLCSTRVNWSIYHQLTTKYAHRQKEFFVQLICRLIAIERQKERERERWLCKWETFCSFPQCYSSVNKLLQATEDMDMWDVWEIWDVWDIWDVGHMGNVGHV